MPLLVLFVTAFVDMIGLTMVIPLLPYYATDFGAGATMIGVLISAFSIAQLAVAPTGAASPTGTGAGRPSWPGSS